MIIKSRTLGTPGSTIWIIVEHIVTVTSNGPNGLAIVETIDGKMHYLTMKAEEVIDAVSIGGDVLHEPA